jgi:Uma2 family endonuclease
MSNSITNPAPAPAPAPSTASPTGDGEARTIPPLTMRWLNGREVVDVEVPRIIPGLPPLPYDTIDVESPDGEVVRFPINMPYDNGAPLESEWHVAAMVLLLDTLKQHFRSRPDVFIGGNMFVHYSLRRALNMDFVGPDVFVVTDVEPDPRPRKTWTIWLEDRSPDLVVELCSPTTKGNDFGDKFRVYESVIHTPEYVVYDPAANKIHAWRLENLKYVPIAPNEHGRHPLPRIGLELGIWCGRVGILEANWPRFFDANGAMLPTGQEEADAEKARADAETARADAEKARADALAAELARQKSERNS